MDGETDMSAKDDTKTFRAETKAWLQENFPSSLREGGAQAILGGRKVDEDTARDAELWRQHLVDQGWGTPTWPKEYGGAGLDGNQLNILQDEMAAIGAYNPIPGMTGNGITMVGPTILDYGTEEQKRSHLPPMARGEIYWCIGYSEPNSGSDLASLSTKAEDNGDCWIINGQKIWTSGADISQWCGMLVRTDSSAKKRDGISFMLVDMNQPGITTRLIKLISGNSPFCETFLTDARAEKDGLLGPLNEGWSVGKRLLQHERFSQTGSRSSAEPSKAERLEDMAKRYVGTDDQGNLADADLRARLVDHLMGARAHSLTLQRIADEARGKIEVSATASILKNSATTVAQTRSELVLEMMGHQGLGWEGAEFKPGELAATRGWLSGKAMSIAGGSFEIQKNIIGKNILGLPETTQQG